MNVYFVVAHPDDVEINAGGTVSKLIAKGKHDVRVIICADCGEDRKEEALNAMLHLGVEADAVTFLQGHVDTNLNDSALAVELDTYLKDADLIFTHHPHDTHQDHRAVSWATQSAGRNCKSILFFVGIYPSGRFYDGVMANVSISYIQEDADRKELALLAHKSQAGKYGDDEWVKAITSGNIADSWRYCGKHGYAEMFQCCRIQLL